MKSILIPGGTGGLGGAVTLRLILDGYHCIVPYNVTGEAQQLRAHLAPQQRDQLLLIEADMLEEADVARVLDVATSEYELYGIVHLLGGIRGFQPIDETPVEDWDFLLNLNLRSLFLVSRLAMKTFRLQQRGRIITIGAMASVKPQAKQAGYGVAKAGVSALTKVLADEGREFGVTANCILPGIIVTPANLEWGSPKDIPNWTKPEQIAGAVAYLLSEEASAVNGTDMRLFGAINI